LVYKKHKIPLLLKLKRFKNSKPIEFFNNLLSFLNPGKKFDGIPGKILLIRNDRIGDAVVTLPVIREIKLNHPQIIIDILVSRSNRFVFSEVDYKDDIIEFDWLPAHNIFIYRLPIIGSLLEFLRYYIIPYFFSSIKRNEIKYLKDKNYDAVIDLVGLKKNIILGKCISEFIAGPKKFIFYLFYNYYLGSNWVTQKDNDNMTRKIEFLFQDAFNLSFRIRNTSLPFIQLPDTTHEEKKAYEIVFHLGTSELRKLSFETERKLIECFKHEKVLIIDSAETTPYLKHKEYFSSMQNIEFRIFETLKDIAKVCLSSKVLVCYDGGQSHYLSQYIRTVSIFGPGSVALWKPFEFSEYNQLCMDSNSVVSIMSNGYFGHITVFLPIWCRPCFDVGCKKRPCIENHKPEFIRDIINNHCLNHG
jgi:ADP-heptose:LPS heptosyltransferase